MKKGKIFVISSASGAGKTTLLKEIFNLFPNLKFSVSATTRKPRTGEIHGRDYLFCSREEFKNMIELNRLAEYKEVHGNLYGTPIEPIKETISEGGNIILDIDVFGKTDFDKVFPSNIGILILPPSSEELERRLRGRGTEDEATIEKRLKKSQEEITYAKQKGRYEYVVINDDFDKALAEFAQIIKKESNV